MDIPITSARYLHERIRFAGKYPPTGFFFWTLPKKIIPPKTKCLLAEYFSEIPGSYVCAPNFHLAYGLCMG